MDRTVKPFNLEIARNLLSTSEQFEPYVPESHQDLLYSLNLLKDLGAITLQSLQVKKTMKEIPAPPPNPLPQAPAHSPKDHKKESHPMIKDQQILEALLELRNSNRLSKRSLSMHSAIIRSKKP